MTRDEGSARFQLRLATAEHHARVDALFGSFDLSQRSQYANFLRTQANAYLPVEQAIERAGISEILSDWPERRRADLLGQDLAELDLTVAGMPPFEVKETRAATIGAAYVLEGSRLGGQLLARGVPERFPRRFICAGGSRLWRDFIVVLERELSSQMQISEAIGEARKVFAVFEASAAQELPLGGCG